MQILELSLVVNVEIETRRDLAEQQEDNFRAYARRLKNLVSFFCF